MKGKTFIQELESNDVKIWVEDDKVKWDAPKGVITDNIVAQMKANKRELLVFLRNKQCTTRLGNKGKNPKKPEKFEGQGDTNNITDSAIAQAQRIILEVLAKNNKKMKDIALVKIPIKPVIQEGDLVIKWDTERGDPDPSGSPTSPQVNKPDDYDGDQNNGPKFGAATCRSPRLLPERCSDTSAHPNKINLGDCFNVLKQIEKSTVDLALTSPPYANLRNYGCDIPVFHPDDYVDWILPLCDQICRVLKPTGSFILNINDCVVKRKRHPYVFDLISRATRETSLRLYDVYFWYKKTSMPNGNQKRLNNVTEYLIHFCKDEKLVKWNMDAVREPYDENTVNRCQYPVSSLNLEVDKKGHPKDRIWKIIQLNQKGKVPSNVFRFPTAAAVRGKNHPAVFHLDLPSWFIKALTDEGDLVLDPFVGSGTTCLAAKLLKRKYIGIEINPAYHKVAVQKVNSATVFDQSQKKNNQTITQIGNREEKRCHQG